MGGHDDELQKCLNLIEAIFDAQQDAKSFRSHCHEICERAQALRPLGEKAQQANPEIGKTEAARVTLRPMNFELEEAVTLIRGCATISQLQKLFDQGEKKRRLQVVLASINKAFPQVEAFLSADTTSPAEPPLQRGEIGGSDIFQQAAIMKPAAAPGPPPPYSQTHQHMLDLL